VKIKSETDLHISTTWGASIFLKGGEEREVGDDMGYQALQQGAVEVREAPKPAPKKPAKKTTAKKKTRARNKDGHYVADDPSTPDVNEAYVEVEDTKTE
jgi:hypothetical protein|tara:strand:- start:1286 stop:1582 length:297 start_codon:yes stop_codon:yes gene_type:complete